MAVSDEKAPSLLLIKVYVECFFRFKDRILLLFIILPIEKHMQSKTMVLYPPCY